jgi:hypothetical protein
MAVEPAGPGPPLSNPISLLHRIWPMPGLGIAVTATVAWSGSFGYVLFRLAF